jgi:hypothetical protein
MSSLLIDQWMKDTAGCADDDPPPDLAPVVGVGVIGI